jgi:hypothetical protein
MSFIDPDMTCLPQAGKRMGSIPMTIWKMIEILMKFSTSWNPLETGLKTDLRLGKWRKNVTSFFQRKVGFRDIKKVHWKSPSGSPLFFLPYRVLLNPLPSLSCPYFLSPLI